MWNGTQPGNEWTALYQRLYQYEQSLTQLTNQVKQLQGQVDELKSKPPLHVEYHFDQLKVNRLEGTLNVGLSPQGIQGLEAFETPDSSGWNVKQWPPDSGGTPVQPIQSLQQQMASYMDTTAPSVLLDTERQLSVTLDDSHRKRVLDDVKKQLKERVHYYAQTADYPAQGTDEERRQWEQDILTKTKLDVQGAFQAYLGKVGKQQERRSESS